MKTLAGWANEKEGKRLQKKKLEGKRIQSYCYKPREQGEKKKSEEFKVTSKTKPCGSDFIDT